ncbi:helix-turn-helix transcriptional regulator [Sphingomonas sp. BN140010]|uniref:Helix-turn-helix transcriptional regulator n=1 Tax=Sphingomonas arvum TaxID=2992113 RepID=A0ABT3JFU5_9SPHN|nr:helix-turn-helix domain-containing protein [Sphingomonas sp. BN140010]MCW3797946.1 helix-turn-helix transcriptional regulator [Sphingomonas sp. BN140010]
MPLEKITKPRRSELRRGYDDACGTAHALELIGERWALLVLRELMLGARRFSDLRADLPGISANVLTQRLEELEERGLIRRKRLPPPAARDVYEATEWGLEAEALVQALGRWAARSPRHDPTLPLSAVSILLSFRTMIDRPAAAGFSGRIGFRFGQESFTAAVEKGGIEVARGPVDGCAAVITTQPTLLAGVVYGGVPFETLNVEGDEALARRFVSLFTLPPKVQLPDS